VRPTFLFGRGIVLRRAVLPCVLAALSLLLPWALAFDPQAWLVWGRDLPGSGLTTADGPSWKPLPLLFTTPLALAGDLAPSLWMILARTGAFVALGGAWRLGRMLGGRTAAVGAVGVTALGPWWAYNAALGNSEGWLAAFVLWAIVSHLERRERLAFVLLAAAGLLRPEIWPFLLVYGAWTWRLGARVLVAGGGVVIVVAWFGPDVVWGAGAISAGDVARTGASPGSAARAVHPGLEVLADAATGVGIAACLAAAFAAWRGSAARVLALLAVAYVLLVAVATFAGYAGNPRYLVPAIAVLAVLAGVGAAWLPWPRLGVAALLALTLAAHAGDLRTAARDVAARSDARRGLDEAIRLSGGAAVLRSCGPVRTVFLTRALVALRTGAPLPGIAGPRPGDGTTLLPPPPTPLQEQIPVASRGPDGQALAVRVGGWSVWSSCR
jgi:hypothetical protein